MSKPGAWFDRSGDIGPVLKHKMVISSVAIATLGRSYDLVDQQLAPLEAVP